MNQTSLQRYVVDAKDYISDEDTSEFSWAGEAPGQLANVLAVTEAESATQTLVPELCHKNPRAKVIHPHAQKADSRGSLSPTAQN